MSSHWGTVSSASSHCTPPVPPSHPSMDSLVHHSQFHQGTKANGFFLVFLLFACATRYMTAYTDSDEEEPSNSQQGQEEQSPSRLCVLLERIDRMHQGTESDKRGSLDVLLEHRDEVSCSSGTPF